MTIITRFAPSPTGYLHIGGARTALFSWLLAKHHGGKFLLRIEDTDRSRSTQPAVDAIVSGLQWLGLQWDDDVVSQFSRMHRHAEAARSLVETGHAYHCFASVEELEDMRAAQRAASQPIRYDGRWRDRDPAEAAPDRKPVIRLKAPLSGETTLVDLVQGSVTVANAQLDDMVLLRADGTPTYMLSVVVDDHDYAITHVLRGDDHFTNTFRQIQLYNAFGWTLPAFGHIPLIHGSDGAKLSKRHGALGIDAYRDMGYLPEALRNYLLRLGWGHGDDEVISTRQAIEWFDTDGLGRSPSRLDFGKLDSLNALYIRDSDDAQLLALIEPYFNVQLDEAARKILMLGMPGLKARAKTLRDLAEGAKFFITRIDPDEKAQAILSYASPVVAQLIDELNLIEPFDAAQIEAAARALADRLEVKLGVLAQPLRAALTGSTVSPPIFEAAALLGRQETIARLTLAAKLRTQ